MTPRFAVVGHPNKGKSSIVSTLAEDSTVAISATPGTTKKTRYFPFRLDGEVLYELVDTPGFQRPRQVLSWLESHSLSAEDRADTVKRFVDSHASDPKFHDECELLQPLISGAGILYVVDGSKPYGIEYEAEMQILQWTGQPRMALINLIGSGDYVEQWRRALGQYFSLVRIFNANDADFSKRVALLKSFAELHEPWHRSINRAVDALRADRKQRQHDSADAIVDLIVMALTANKSLRLGEGIDPAVQIAKLENQLRTELRSAEQKVWHRIASIYRLESVEVLETGSETLALDLFSSESEELFGLSRSQLATAGILSGAAAGTGVDIMLGGASLLAGATIGAILGGGSALLGADRLSKIKLLGQSLVHKNLKVGPFRDLNLPWVLLGRAVLYHQLVAERNHARREAIEISFQRSQFVANEIPDDIVRKLNRKFSEMRRSGYEKSSDELLQCVSAILKTE